MDANKGDIHVGGAQMLTFQLSSSETSTRRLNSKWERRLIYTPGGGNDDDDDQPKWSSFMTTKS